MATDYKKIGENPRINYRKIFTPYSDKTHFVYELIQNADDNESGCIELQLYENELIVWNDGNEFSEEDVRSICSIGFSNKDLTQIGTFGMGFKAVYTYTDSPEVYSGDERFRLSINNPTKPEGIGADIDARVSEQLKAGERQEENRTIFRLPFREKLRQEEEIALLKDRLCDLEKRALLFLRNLETVRWYDKNSGQMGTYSCHRRPYNKIQDTFEVELRASLNGENQSSETFLVFRKEVRPPQMVVDELLQQSEDEDERQRIQRSANKLQPVEVAFKIQDGKITAMNKCVLFSYFPTEKETHLRFFIQASYKTTLDRENIEKNNQWNKWLIRETANFLPDVLEQLKAGELLKPAFFNVLPLIDDDVPDEFSPIAGALRKAMQERIFVPTQDNMYAKAADVFYPHRESLRELIKSDWLYPNSSWLHPKIRNTEEFRRGFKVMREAGVKEMEVDQVLDWLKKQESKWFEDRCVGWLRSLYIYLNSQKSELERIKKLLLVRLENGKHVRANEQLVFFPSDADETREEIKPFLNDLPILQSALLAGEERGEIEIFLKSVGVRVLRRVDMILEGICPQYSESAKPSTEGNLLHVRYIFKVWNDVSESERSRLKARISEIPILHAYKGIEREVSDLVVPCDAYLPKTYTGNSDLEIYFSGYDEGIWLVDEAYLEDKSDVEGWLQFLRAIGTMDTPLVIEGNIARNSENHQEFNAELAKRDIVWKYTTRWWKTSIEDLYLQGLPEALDKVSKCGKVDLSQVIWQLLVKIVKPLPSEESPRNNFFRKHFQGTYRWFYYSDQSKRFDATFYRQLKSTAWIPDEKGKFHTPSKCFVPTSENRKVLGNSVVYLPEDFDISTESARWLAEKLDVCMEADPESVLNHLQKLRNDKEISIKKVEPLYRFLRSETEGTQLHEKFKKEPLILTLNPEPRWWRSDEVFWEDESAVFDNDRGYLKAHYTENLKSFFINHLGVTQNATALDYVDGIQRVKSMKQTVDAKVSERLKTLYGCLWKSIQKSDSGFLSRQDPHLRKKFKEEHLIFTPSPEPRWWRSDEVFWEDESVVFGSHCGYLKAHYPETFKLFFSTLGSPERASVLDYIRGIQKITSAGQAEDAEIRKRIKLLYGRLWQSLQENETWQETEEWRQTRESRCWLGKKGSEWEFFSRCELAWNDHNHIAEIFEGEVPFWGFDDLLEFAKSLEIEGCSQAKIEFHPEGDQEEDTGSSEEVRNLRPYIHAFLNSPRLCEAHEGGKSVCDLDSLSVCLVEGLETVYTLKGISLSDPNPHESFLDVTNQKVTLWLALAADKDDYTLLIGNALRDYFGIEGLGRFIEHLLTKKTEKVLEHWKREGLRTEFCELLPKTDAEEDVEKQSERVDEKIPDESMGKDADVVADESEVEIPIDNKIPKTDDEDNDSLTNKADESEIYLSKNGDDNSGTDGPEIKTPTDSETTEVDKSDNGSTLDESESPTNPVSDIRNISSPDTQVSTNTGSGTTQNANEKSESETPIVHEDPETENGNEDSTENESETPTYQSRPGENRTRQRYGHRSSTPNRSRGIGYSARGGGEGEEHRTLKEYLANNPSELGEGLTLVRTEYEFESGDRVDILLRDSSGNPVTVEVKPYILPGSYGEVWQAVRYKHIAAVQYKLLSCKQVRSILAAPEIPDDVKAKCKELGIEPFEKPEL